MIFHDALLLKSAAIFLFTAGFSVYSWKSGRSFLVYQLVTKRDNPKEYWAATLIITICALVSLAAVIHLFILDIQ
jgi:hypothetical protein